MNMPETIEGKPHKPYRPLLLLAGFFFLVKTAGALLESFATAAFIKRFGVEYLPFVYIGNTLLAYFLLNTFGRLFDRRKRHRILVGMALGSLVLLAVFRWGFAGAKSSWPFLFLVVEQLGSLFSVAFWLLAGESYTPRQAKTVFPKIASGGIAGSALGAFLSSGASSAGLTAYLVPAGALFYLLGGVLLAVRSGKLSAGRQVVFKKQIKAEEKGVVALFRKYRLLRLLTLVVVVPALIKPLLDYQFSFFIDKTYASEQGLLTFYGLFKGSFAIVMLFIHLFVTGKIFLRFGIARVMMVLPVTQALYFLFSFPFPNIWAGVFGKVTSKVVKKTMNDSARKNLYSFFPDGVRSRVGLFLKGTVVRLGGLTGSGLLYLLSSLGGIHLISAVGLSFAFLGIWVTRKLIRSYSTIVANAISSRQLDLEELSGLGSSVITAETADRLRGWLEPSDPDLALHAARFLLNAGREEDTARVIASMKLFTARYQREIFSLIENTRNKKFADMLLADPVCEGKHLQPDVVRLYAVCGKDGYVDRINGALESGEGPLFAAGVAAACNSGEDKLFERGVTALNDLVSFGNKTIAAGVVRSLDNPVLQGLLKKFLRDDSGRIVRAALEALAGYSAPNVLSEIRTLLLRKETGIRKRCIQVLGAIGGREAAGLLIPMLADPARSIERSSRAALIRCGKNAVPALLAAVESARHLRIANAALQILSGFGKEAELDRETLLKKWLYRVARIREGTVIASRKSSPAFHLLDKLFREQLKTARLILVRILTLGRKSGLTDSVLKGLASLDKNEVALAVEMVDTLIPKEFRKIIIPLFEGAPPRSLVERSAAQLLTDLVLHGSQESKSMALYAIGEHGNSAFFPLLEKILAGKDTHLCGLAASAILRIKTGRSHMKQELSVIDRLLFLEKVAIFSDLSIRELTAIARITEEVRYADGKTVFKEGGAAENMFLVVDGEVSILKQSGGRDVQLAELHRGDCFGEMALFEKKERSASAVVRGATRLLRLGGYDFEQIMHEYPAISINVCRVFSHRLRETNELLRGV